MRQKKICAIAYHEDYNKYDLGIGHPLIGDKPKKTMQFLEEKKLTKNITIFKPEKATKEDLLRVHDSKYVEHVKELSEKGGMLAADTPAPKGIYEIACIPTGGTILAGEKLFNGFECAANPLAGFHHASRSFSSGFCFFNDIAIVIEYIREKYKLKRFQIVDLDVHHPNGTQEIYYDDPTVLKISFHQDGRTLYPGTGAMDKIGKNSGKGYNINLPLPPETGSKSYLEAFDKIIPPLTKQFNPEILIYQCGVDTHHSDPLANINLVHQTFFNLAKKMKNLSDGSCKKLLVLFGGGYNSNESLISYYNIMCGLLNNNEYIREKEIEDLRYNDVKKLIDKLINNLLHFWDF